MIASQTRCAFLFVVCPALLPGIVFWRAPTSIPSQCSVVQLNEFLFVLTAPGRLCTKQKEICEVIHRISKANHFQIDEHKTFCKSVPNEVARMWIPVNHSPPIVWLVDPLFKVLPVGFLKCSVHTLDCVGVKFAVHTSGPILRALLFPCKLNCFVQFVVRLLVFAQKVLLLTQPRSLLYELLVHPEITMHAAEYFHSLFCNFIASHNITAKTYWLIQIWPY